MKQISIYSLKPGDIFAKEIILKGRVAYLVKENDEQSTMLTAINRNTGNEVKIQKIRSQHVIFLRHDDTFEAPEQKVKTNDFNVSKAWNNENH